jgi:hypothetical protein
LTFGKQNIASESYPDAFPMIKRKSFCPKCLWPIETEDFITALFMVYSLGSPLKYCRQCGTQYSTDKKEWSSLQPAVQKVYLVMQAIVGVAFAFIIYLVCAFIVEATVPGWGLLAVVPAIGAIWLMWLSTKSAIRSSQLRTSLYFVATAGGQVDSDTYSYYQIAQNVSFGMWPLDVQIYDSTTPASKWMSVAWLLVSGDDLDIIRRIERIKK